MLFQRIRNSQKQTDLVGTIYVVHYLMLFNLHVSARNAILYVREQFKAIRAKPGKREMSRSTKRSRALNREWQAH